MAEAKDPAIKLFGKTIPLQEIPSDSTNDNGYCSNNRPPHDDDDDHDVDDGHDDDDDDVDDDDDIIINNNTEDMEEDTVAVLAEHKETHKIDHDEKTFQITQVGPSPEVSDKSTCQDVSVGCDIPEALSGVDDKAAGESSKQEEAKSETSASQDKAPKKPDKILPCPRCNSMDTKFCYYNNYNVNQPRHFCKNCQRYWTAGGTMRNVPVGAGRRKNKNSASHYRHITIPETLHNPRPDIPNGVHPAVPANGAVLTFSSDAPLCESMASILNLAEKTRNCPPNGFQKPDELKISIPLGSLENGGSHVDGSNSKDDANKSTPKEPAAQNCLPFPPQIPCYPGAPWPYPWNSAQWSPPVATPPFCPNGFAMPFYPAPPYWGCTVPGSWNIPWMAAQPSPMSPSNPSSAPNSPLGKHSRDGHMLTSTNSEEKELEENNSERSLWIPKTLRIDDPGEAAKSSIWTTLGIKNGEKPDSIGRGSGLFKAFQSKRDEANPHMETSAVLEANPAALSRSQNFQENS